jgi:hypothetical protein
MLSGGSMERPGLRQLLRGINADRIDTVVATAETSAEVDPEGLAVDSAGNLYIANWPNAIRKVDAKTGISSRFAGNGYAGSNGDGGSPTVASICDPAGMAIDASGSLYFATLCEARVRKVSYPTQAATPSFSPAAGTYTGTQSVAITDSTANATIYYTTDGSTPTTGSTQYNGAISVLASETVTAIAVSPGFTESASASAAYVINQVPSNPMPGINSLSPAITDAGGTAFTLTVNGSSFVSSSTVYWGSTALTTKYVNATQLTAQVPSSAIQASGISVITVQTPTPGGGTSNSLDFEVDTAGTTPPGFATTSATVTAGSSATYNVAFPSSATDVSAQCLNLPTGASCSYSASSGSVTITTSSTTPSGTYQIIVVFTEILPGAVASILFPFSVLPSFICGRS